MSTKKIVKAGFAIIVVSIVAYSIYNASGSFEEKIENTRETYEEELRTMEGSPLEGLDGSLSYFDYNNEWKVNGTYTPVVGSARTFSVAMTDGSFEQIELAGEFSIVMNGQEVTLFLFDEGETLLLPYTDETSGGDTYGGGRYINISKSDIIDGTLTVDFNQAHNFYCAYTPNYICPVPPKENHVPFAVTAGEKVYR